LTDHSVAKGDVRRSAVHNNPIARADVDAREVDIGVQTVGRVLDIDCARDLD
jgi:hypothetical protein